MRLSEILRPRVQEAYCLVCNDYRRDVCVTCRRCDGCGHKQDCLTLARDDAEEATTRPR